MVHFSYRLVRENHGEKEQDRGLKDTKETAKDVLGFVKMLGIILAMVVGFALLGFVTFYLYQYASTGDFFTF